MATKAYRQFAQIVRAPGVLLKGTRLLGMRVINNSGSSIAADKIVAISGYSTTSKLPKIVLADADILASSGDLYVTRAAIANGSKGDVFKGALSAATLDTSGATTVGDAVYLSGTAGGFTSTPTGQIVGYVQVKSSTVGQILWDIQPSQGIVSYASGTITAANLVATTAGTFGHASGVVMAAAPGAGVALQLIAAGMYYTFGVAAYTGGGNITVNWGSGGAALTGLVSAANSVGAASSKALFFVPLTTVAIPIVSNASLNLVTSAAFTQPGTATGTIAWELWFRPMAVGF